jgi:hypothetical protein
MRDDFQHFLDVMRKTTVAAINPDEPLDTFSLSLYECRAVNQKSSRLVPNRIEHVGQFMTRFKPHKPGVRMSFNELR